jgi:hypothetical protein
LPTKVFQYIDLGAKGILKLGYKYTQIPGSNTVEFEYTLIIFPLQSFNIKELFE